MSDTLIPLLDSSAVDFSQRLDALLAWDSVANPELDSRVDEIIAAVRRQGDEALVEFTRRFDRRQLSGVGELVLTPADCQAALQRINEQQRGQLELAAQRVDQYHQHQKQSSWQYEEADGTVLGQKVTPLDRVGIYVPGGKASYPSSVLMSAIPARVAGVGEIIMVVPAPDGLLSDMVLAAAAIAGVDRVVTIGGAQAVAALAYGTPSVPKVDKIVGPGNIYVAAAKRKVFGVVGLDMVAGPSEILIVCDGGTPPDWIAMDLFSQAEHDENAQAMLLCPDQQYINQVYASIEKLLPEMERSKIIADSLKGRGALIKVADLEEAVALVNRIAPEHLELSVDEPQALADKVQNAGAIFMGRYTAEALGDYCAGPSHVLPTSTTARFSSPLGVYDFQKRSSVINCSAAGANALGPLAAGLARSESLTAHARSAEYRVQTEVGDGNE
jgi:histidinol dehydrogenase